MSQILKSGGSGGGSGTLNNVNVTNGTPNFIKTGSTEDIDYGVTNIAIGSSLPSLTTATLNVGLGFDVLKSITSGVRNVAIGYESSKSLINSARNTAVGYQSLSTFTVGSASQGSNTAIGHAAGTALATGIYNTFLGTAGTSGSGSAYTTSESSNIVIGNVGVIAESNVIRIGTDGTGDGQQSLMYTAGLLTSARGFVATTGNLELPFTTSATNGVVTMAGSTFIHAYGPTAASDNIFIGRSSGNFTSGATTFGNLGIGNSVFSALGNGAIWNNAYGYRSLRFITTGDNNNALGYKALTDLLTGSYNVALGGITGTAYTSSESSNILLGYGVVGTITESNVCRIGVATGTGDGELAATYIAGIRGVTTANADAVAVLIDSAGQLGTVSSSEKVKDEIVDMDSYSDGIMKLRPTVFHYKKNAPGVKSVGLIAEEVDKIVPQLVVYDEEGLPETVRYLDLIPMLLNEVQKLRKELNALKGLSAVASAKEEA